MAIAEGAGKNTKKFISAYFERAPVSGFLASMFQTPAVNFHATEEVTIDIERSDEEVAVAIKDLSQGWRDNSADLFTNKGFIPPIFKERSPLNAFNLLKRDAGQAEFGDVNFRAQAAVRSFNVMNKMMDKILRSIELQASEVLQTGKINLIDSSGATQYSIDYKPKATHFPTTGVSWAGGAGDPLGDLAALAGVLRGDGKLDPDQLIMGNVAFNNFISNSDVQDRLDLRRLNIGAINPIENRNGAQFRGTVDIDNYKFDIWTYNGKFKNPATGTITNFVSSDKVIMKSSTSRLDLTFGAIPRIAPADAAAVRFLPRRMSSARRGQDMFTNAWFTPDRETLFVGVGARPLAIPTAIDTYGCLDTIP